MPLIPGHLLVKKGGEHIVAWWNFKKNRQEERELRATIEQILLGVVPDESQISREQAMTIPAVAAGVNLISDTVASLPIKLYKKDGTKTTLLDSDTRASMLNCDTGDTLDAFQFKKALVTDYLVMGSGYAYINRKGNNVKSLNFVRNEQVAIRQNFDPIFKTNNFLVYGAEYHDWEFFKITRKTYDGATGFGILEENNKLLSVAYNTLIFEDLLFRTGGQKKGFLKSASRLSKDAMDSLKAAYASLYKNNTENMILLNNGLEFQEISNNSVELQLQQAKETNFEEISKILAIPSALLGGKTITGIGDLFDAFVKMAILPILKAFETALNKDLLLPSEHGKLYFEFDTTGLLKGDILKRFQAYQIAVKEGIFQVDEVREMENREPLGLDFIKLGLQDVLYDVKTKTIYTPNTNKQVTMGKGGTEPQPKDKPPEEMLKPNMMNDKTA
jgi:HK97 family phage portal protein